ncbi:pseudouridine synthase [Alcanivorax sp. IL3]|uniref:pseudouridine synthase n=1 Tax=unclassified Alcanivorax TaxID=2638842 RepID=UPI0039C285A4
MTSRYHRLDRFLSNRLQISRSNLRLLLAAGRVQVNDEVERDRQRRIGPFDVVVCDGEILQANRPRYLMINKPPAVVSATRDDHHHTVLDLLPEDQREGLHLAGQLDFNSTGLVLLTNDGDWSRQLSQPENQVRKHYRVTVEKPLTEEYVAAFSEGMWFEYEGIVTRPAELSIRSACEADVWLCEGRYHQIKRMFGRFDNKVLTLHRLAIGNLVLDEKLKPGEWRELTSSELAVFLD